jgi:hypothetical protein
VVGFGPRAPLGCFDEACFDDLTITLMLLEFCECCFAETGPPRRSRMALTFGAEGVEGRSSAPKV